MLDQLLLGAFEYAILSACDVLPFICTAHFFVNLVSQLILLRYSYDHPKNTPDILLIVIPYAFSF